jgi:hypothetical protein
VTAGESVSETASSDIGVPHANLVPPFTDPLENVSPANEMGKYTKEAASAAMFMRDEQS